MKNLWLTAVLICVSGICMAQLKQLSLSECHSLAEENYPLVKQHDLIAKAGAFNISNAAKLYLPQVSFSGQATYQSQTVNFAEAVGGKLPFSIPALSKDQYKVQGEISQLIYDGGTGANIRNNAAMNTAVQQQNLKVSLYALHERINQLYFSILLLTQQQVQNNLRKADLQNLIGKASAALQNGTAFRSQVNELKAELSNAELTGIEFRESKLAYLQMLGVFINKPLDESTDLQVPADFSALAQNARPELKLFELRRQAIDLQEKQLSTDYTPKLSAFFQGAYGRPTLNFISNEFGFWYLGGLRFSWNIGSLYTLQNNRSLLGINRQAIDVEKEVFLFNSKLNLEQENAEVRKYRAMLVQADSGLAYRISVKKAAEAQLANGVITTHEFISKLNAENLARQALIVNRIQLLRAQYSIKNTLGI
ncbi:MAG: TolC family protein [Bacteroidota bacterium]